MIDKIKIGKKSVYTTIVTPKGELTGYNAIFKPSTQFDKKGLYSANILLSKEDGEILLEVVKEIQKEQFKNFKNKGDKLTEITSLKPYSTIDDDGNEIKDEKGRYLLKTKAEAGIEEGSETAKNHIAVFDSKLKPIKELNIGNGSIVKLKIDLSGYCIGGKVGVSVRLKSIQVIKYIPYSADTSTEGFEEEEGFEIEEKISDTINNSDESEEIPF